MKPSVLAVAFALASTLMPPVSAQDAAPAQPKAPAVKPGVQAKNVTPDEAEKLIKETPGLIVLDVRSPEEFDHQHIKGAVNVNVRSDEFDAEIAKLDQSKPVLVHCQSGSRSTDAVEGLQVKSKFPQIYHLNSGMTGWKKAGKPIEEKPLPGAAPAKPGKPAPAPKPADK